VKHKYVFKLLQCSKFISHVVVGKLIRRIRYTGTTWFTTRSKFFLLKSLLHFLKDLTVQFCMTEKLIPWAVIYHFCKIVFLYSKIFCTELNRYLLSCLIKGFTIPMVYPTKLFSIVNTCCKLIDLFIIS
jgi:hypothetical protein